MDTSKSFEAIIGSLILLLCGLFFTHIMKSNSFSKQGEKYNDTFYAKFNDIEGIKVGTEVKMSGLRVGFVKSIELEKDTFDVKVKINVIENLNIPSDSVISVSSSGLLGGKYLRIKPGIEENYLKNGNLFVNTQSSMNIEDLIGRVVASFGSK